MEFELGIVCARCEAYAALGTASCGACGHALALEAAAPVSQKAPPTTKNASASSVVAPSRPEPAPVSAPPRTVGVVPREEPDEDDPYGSTLPNVGSLPRGRRPDPRAEEDGPTIERPPRSQSSPALSATSATRSKSKSIEELMEQAKNFVCRSCSTPVPMGHKFCGRCGAAVPPEILNARTQFFGQLQAPGKAKLILIRGEGVEGLSYQLNAEHHVVGRSGQLVFPDDPFVSPTHADFFYRSGKLVVKDMGSVNGVFMRVRGSVDIEPGDCFLAGEQVFRLDATPPLHDEPGEDGTFFYSSPKHKTSFRVTQILQGGTFGMTVCARGTSLQIGREGGDLNFPSDLYMSASHCKLEEVAGKFLLTDLTSRNGTYLRIRDERELTHGDYLFIGRKLLRVEITAA
jgi:pSer/pThr/pTyr-binding forkhead associated (FHA) protein